jgi:AraC family transcriptional regulator, transcriptional activator of pobA
MIPHYFLYEEAASETEPTFLHIEAVRVRSSRHDWTIEPHSHPDHHQILILDNGGGTIEVEGETWDLSPPALVVVPALTVHAFRFKRDTNGYVITVAPTFLRSTFGDDPDLLNGFLAPNRFLQDQLGRDIDLVGIFASLEREFVWAAPARRAAIKAYLQLIAVTITRLLGKGSRPSAPSSRDAETVMRFRELIEENYRSHPPLTFFAGKLGVTTARLNACCRAIAGRSSLALFNERILIEARRNLLYSEMNVADIGLSLGFSDPGYFNRFFTRSTGVSPGKFRHNAFLSLRV